MSFAAPVLAVPTLMTMRQRSIRIQVTRPKELTEFGGEWVQAYEKDSWANVTNECDQLAQPTPSLNDLCIIEGGRHCAPPGRNSGNALEY